MRINLNYNLRDFIFSILIFTFLLTNTSTLYSQNNVIEPLYKNCSNVQNLNIEQKNTTTLEISQAKEDDNINKNESPKISFVNSRLSQ